MPFQSEKQRRYLWANEPKIARDWTDTYGSGIAKALGGRIQYQRGGPGPGGQGARGQATQNPGRSAAPSGPPGGGDQAMTYTAPVNRHTGPTNQEAYLAGQKKKAMRDLIAKQQAEKQDVFQRPGPQLGGLKNWGANYAGANVGAGIGSMLLGGLPGLILGTLFGGRTSRNLMNPRYKGSTLQDRLKNIFAFSNDYIPDQRTPTGIETTANQSNPHWDQADKLSLLINDPNDPRYRWRMMQKRKEEEELRALRTQGITMEDLMGRVG